MNIRRLFSANGSSVELNNCVTEARECMSDHNAAVSARVAEAVGQGKFVAVGYRSWHCRSTDAVVGEGAGIIGIYNTRDQLEQAMRAYQPDDDERVEYRPALPVPASEVPAEDRAEVDNVPF